MQSNGVNIFSRTMRPSDYDALKPQLEHVDLIQSWTPQHPDQHGHRRWEYAMALRAVQAWESYQIRKTNGLRISDWGTGVSLLPAMMMALGDDVDMYEPWAPYGKDESAFQHRQIANVMSHVLNAPHDEPRSSLSNTSLLQVPESLHGKYDVSFCISTLEHIREEELAFRNLCKTVRAGGLIFLTMDFADNDGPHSLDYVRARMYTKESMFRLSEIGASEGFAWLGDAVDWSWAPDRRMVFDYGFCSLAMEKAL